MDDIFSDLLGGRPAPVPSVDPKVHKLLRLAANNPSDEEAASALKKALELLEEPQYFNNTVIGSEHIGDRESGFTLLIEVSSTGKFFVTYDGEGRIGQGDTLEQAVAAAKATLRKTRRQVAVPFVTDQGVRATAIGLSLSDGSTICRDDEGKPFTVEQHGTETFKADMTEEELAAYRAAVEQETAAWAIISETRRKYRLHLRSAVDEAIKKVLQ